MLSTEAGTQEVHDMLAEIMISEKLLVAEWPSETWGNLQAWVGVKWTQTHINTTCYPKGVRGGNKVLDSTTQSSEYWFLWQPGGHHGGGGRKVCSLTLCPSSTHYIFLYNVWALPDTSAMKLLTHVLLKQNVWALYLVTDHGQWPQWSGLKGGQMLVMLMDAACCLPYLQARSLGIHSASQIDFSCPLFKLPPTPPPPASEGAEICWGTSIKPVEALLFVSDWIHKFVLPQSSCSELTSSSWIHEFGRKWTKGTEEPNFELNCGMFVSNFH